MLGASSLAGKASEMASLIGVRGLADTTASFRRALYEGATKRGWNPDYLACVMSFESGFKPGARNQYSNALGLIQWVSDSSFDATARRAGMNVKRSQLPELTAAEQLPLVFAWYDGKGITGSSSVTDYYLAVFMPALVGKPTSYVAARSGTKAYEQNAGFDRDGKGYYTVGDIGRSIQSVLAEGLKAPRVDVPGVTELPVRFGSPIVVAALVAAVAYWALPRVPFTRKALSLA